MSPWETCRRQCSNPGCFNRKSLLSICSLDREVYDTIPDGLAQIVTLSERLLCKEVSLECYIEETDKWFSLSERLRTAFVQNGSDKSTTHDYHRLYAHLFLNCKKVDSILEIGLGSNNVNLLSNMGPNGKPGASLRAFRQIFPDADIFGADIDTNILFQEDGIRTHYVDQLDPDSLLTLNEVFGPSFDFIIDDGLHTFQANVNVILKLLPNISQGGVLVIEDINPRLGALWSVVGSILEGKFEATLVRTKAALVFVVTRK
jgi:hypothetical protein